MDIEQSPIGKFDDLFFRFDSSYNGDSVIFEEELWTEFLSWFTPSPNPKMDIHQALYENHFLTDLFVPRVDLPHTAETLWSELLRFRQSINGITSPFQRIAKTTFQNGLKRSLTISPMACV